MARCESSGCYENALAGEDLCERCKAREEANAWIDATYDRLAAAAKAGGWSLHLESIASTRTHYYTLSRELHPDDPDDLDEEEIVVRIGDHGSAHCSETYSLAMVAGGDDHDVEAVLLKIAQPR